MENDFPRMRMDLGHSGDRQTFSFEEEFSLKGPEEDLIPCRASVTALMTRTGNRYLLEGQISAVLRSDCSRCLEPFDLKIDTEFSFVLQRGGDIPEGVEEEDFKLLSEAEEYDYDLFPRVRETLLLEMPIKYLCSEDCAGICPGCGADLNKGACSCGEKEGDPRWDALKKMLKEKDER